MLLQLLIYLFNIYSVNRSSCKTKLLVNSNCFYYQTSPMFYMEKKKLFNKIILQRTSFLKPTIGILRTKDFGRSLIPANNSNIYYSLEKIAQILLDIINFSFIFTDTQFQWSHSFKLTPYVHNYTKHTEFKLTFVNWSPFSHPTICSYKNWNEFSSTLCWSIRDHVTSILWMLPCMPEPQDIVSINQMNGFN